VSLEPLLEECDGKKKVRCLHEGALYICKRFQEICTNSLLRPLQRHTRARMHSNARVYFIHKTTRQMARPNTKMFLFLEKCLGLIHIYTHTQKHARVHMRTHPDIRPHAKKLFLSLSLFRARVLPLSRARARVCARAFSLSHTLSLFLSLLLFLPLSFFLSHRETRISPNVYPVLNMNMHIMHIINA